MRDRRGTGGGGAGGGPEWRGLQLGRGTWEMDVEHDMDVGRGAWGVGRGAWGVGRGAWGVGRGTWTWDVGRGMAQNALNPLLGPRKKCNRLGANNRGEYTDMTSVS